MTITSTIGTLVWVGSTDRPETQAFYQYCVEHAPQIAVRRDLEHLVSFPAEHVSRIVVVRNDRAVAGDWPRKLKAIFPNAELAMVLGSGCEGEARTGNPWPNFQACYWHQWNQVVPDWFPQAALKQEKQNPQIILPETMLIVTSNRDVVEGLRIALSELGHSVIVDRDFVPNRISNLGVCIWDDTAAAPTNAAGWRRRFVGDLQFAVSRSVASYPRHYLLVGFPRIEDWCGARLAGCADLYSKPYNPIRVADLITHR